MNGDRRDDAELVAAVLAGDREAFGPLLARWQRACCGCAERSTEARIDSRVTICSGLRYDSWRECCQRNERGSWLNVVTLNVQLSGVGGEGRCKLRFRAVVEWWAKLIP
jgi:hypothetical protein